MNLMKIYDGLPIVMQNLVVTAEGYRIKKNRFNHFFDKQYSDFMLRADYSYQQKCNYRDERLKLMVKHCYETVPYYHRYFEEAGIDYRRIKTIDDLNLLPIINKNIIKENYDSFFSSKFKRRDLKSQHTSGSTGSGFVFYVDRDADAAVWADVWRWYTQLGINRKMMRAYFGGRPIVPKEQMQPPFYRIDKFGNQILFSGYHMNDAFFGECIEVLNKYRPEWIQAYPSSISLVADYMEKRGVRLSYQPKVITLSSENVLDNTYVLIERVFGIRPYQNYAQTEGVATFREQVDGRILVEEDFSAVELIADSQLSDSYRIIGSTLFNFAMPFLRYDTGDLARCFESKDGRIIDTIDGRSEDYIVLQNGEKVGRLDHIFKDQTNVIGAQVIQRKDGSVEFHIIPGPEYSLDDYNRLQSVIDAYIGNRCVYRIVPKQKLMKSKNGKQRFVISEMK